MKTPEGNFNIDVVYLNYEQVEFNYSSNYLDEDTCMLEERQRGGAGGSVLSRSAAF